MKGIPIKFRGRCIETGEYVFGDFKTTNHLEPNQALITSTDITRANAWVVDADSVAQLCGYDADGNEVYEGDKVKVGDEVVTVHWNNNCTCVAVTWANGLSDSFGTVRFHYDSKPYLIKGGNDE